MKKILILASFLMLLNSNLFSQDPVFRFYGEYYEENVYLAWIPEVWPKELTGIILKRLDENNSWHAVTKTVVIPASYVEKDLSNVEPDPAQRERLKHKLDSLIKNGKGREVSNKAYSDEILPKSNLNTSIAMIFALDYDLLILNGFGAIDRNIKSERPLQYGLFLVYGKNISENPITEITIPITRTEQDFLQMTPSAEVIGKNSKLRLHWKFDRAAFLERDIKGFNLYVINKNGGSRINDKTIWITSKSDPVDLNYVVDFPKTKIIYAAVPVSYFGIEHEPNALSFRPEIYSIKIPAPFLTTTIEANQCRLTWELAHGYDSLINKTLIQVKQQGSGYTTLQELTPSERVFNYSLSTSGDKLQFRIVLITSQNSKILSNERYVNYNPKAKVAAPDNLSGAIVNLSGEWFVELIWEYSQDTTGISFRVFTDGPDNGLIYSSSFPRPIQPPYLVPIKSSLSKIQHFAIQAMAPDRSKSELSNTIEIITPSRRLPPTQILSALQVERGIQLNWQFSDDILDLAGFKIEVDGELFLNEDTVDARLRNYVLTGLEEGSYQINIQPITIYGIEGEKSNLYKITVQ